MRYLNTRLAIAFASLLVLCCSAVTFAQQGIDPRIDSQIMVRVKPGQDLADFVTAFESAHPTVGVGLADSIESRSTYLLNLSLPPDYSEQFINALSDDLEANYTSLLTWGEFVYENQAPEGKTGSTWAGSVGDVNTYSEQFAVNMLGLGPARQISMGQGVGVAVVDTGVDASHPMLADHVLDSGFNFVRNDTDTSDVGDGIDNDEDGSTDEMAGHGTFVTGLITLVAPDARILPVTVLNPDGVGTGWIHAKGLYFAIDHGVEVINLSLSSTYKAEAVEDAIEEALSHGIVVVAAAGNFDREEPREFPAMSSDALGVAATDDNDVKGDFSNYNDKLFISAPGASYLDPDRAIISTLPGNDYAAWEGTSMAVPLVSGAAALIRAQHPEWNPDWTTSDQIANLLATTAVNIDDQNPGYLDMLGAGRLDVIAAVAEGPLAPELGDLNADGAVNIDDLFDVLAEWGETHSSADLNSDGTVNIDDVFVVLSRWG